MKYSVSVMNEVCVEGVVQIDSICCLMLINGCAHCCLTLFDD